MATELSDSQFLPQGEENQINHSPKLPRRSILAGAALAAASLIASRFIPSSPSSEERESRPALAPDVPEPVGGYGKELRVKSASEVTFMLPEEAQVWFDNRNKKNPQARMLLPFNRTGFPINMTDLERVASKDGKNVRDRGVGFKLDSDTEIISFLPIATALLDEKPTGYPGAKMIHLVGADEYAQGYDFSVIVGGESELLTKFDKIDLSSGLPSTGILKIGDPILNVSIPGTVRTPLSPDATRDPSKQFHMIIINSPRDGNPREASDGSNVLEFSNISSDRIIKTDADTYVMVNPNRR